MARGDWRPSGRLVQAAVVGATMVALFPIPAAATASAPAGVSSRVQQAVPTTVQRGSVGAGVELAQYELSRVLILHKGHRVWPRPNCAREREVDRGGGDLSSRSTRLLHSRDWADQGAGPRPS